MSRESRGAQNPKILDWLDELGLIAVLGASGNRIGITRVGLLTCLADRDRILRNRVLGWRFFGGLDRILYLRLCVSRLNGLNRIAHG